MNQKTPPEPPFRLYSDLLPLKDRSTPNFLSTRANKMRVKANAKECPQTTVVATIPAIPNTLPTNTLTDGNLLGK